MISHSALIYHKHFAVSSHFPLYCFLLGSLSGEILNAGLWLVASEPQRKMTPAKPH